MPGGERSEQATPKRRQDAREKGQVLKSIEVNTAAILIGAAAFLQWTLPSMSRSFMELTTHTFESAAVTDFSTATLHAKLIGLTLFVLRLIGPILLGLVAVALISNVAQFGFLMSSQALRPQFSRVNPLEGFKRIYSSRALVELVKTIIKVTVIGGFAWQALRDKGNLLALLAGMEPGNAGSTVVSTSLGVVWKVAGAFVAIAAVDFMYQRWFFNRSLKMTREEIKEEFKQQEGDPQIRARLRQRARALARQRMMQQVPKADVVITNPTHFAVALKYEPGMAAPVVIAKGERLVAQQIKKIAREHGIPTVENKPLAQALFKACDIGQSVPPDLYKAVAEVLAFVYRVRPDRAPTGYSPAAA